MKIIVLTSRYTASRDIINEDFGRQIRIFSGLRKLGYDIDLFCVDQKRKEHRNLKLHGMNVVIRPFSFLRLPKFLMNLFDTLKRKRYDLFIVSKEPLWALFAYVCSRIFKVDLIYDWHDNYETYESYKIPFFKYVDRYIVRKCKKVTCVSYALKDKLIKIKGKDVFVVENGVDLNLFKPLNKSICRKKLNLPKKAKIIGYIGNISKEKEISLLIDSFKELKKDNIYLLIAGEIMYKNFDLEQKNLIYLGPLNQKDVVVAINACDVAVIPSRINAFSKYCFPYKCVEYMACNVPIVATAVGDVKRLLDKDSLCKVETKDMIKKIKKQFDNRKINYRKELKDYSWENLAKKMNEVMQG